MKYCVDTIATIILIIRIILILIIITMIIIIIMLILIYVSFSSINNALSPPTISRLHVFFLPHTVTFLRYFVRHRP